ncbi:hypothetical protein LINPERHAP2_LOCUS36803 [Linum perenne]
MVWLSNIENEPGVWSVNPLIESPPRIIPQAINVTNILTVRIGATKNDFVVLCFGIKSKPNLNFAWARNFKLLGQNFSFCSGGIPQDNE